VRCGRPYNRVDNRRIVVHELIPECHDLA